MSPRAILVGCSLLVAATAAAAQDEPPDRSLQFDWPDEALIEVTSENWRGERSFTLRYVLEIRRASATRLRVGRRDVSVTEWNGKPVPESARNQLAPIELQTELLPDVLIDSYGRAHGVEPAAEFRERAATRIAERIEAGTVEPAAATQLTATLDAPGAFRSLTVQAKKPWDEWIGRYRDLDFAEDATAEFVGEIELATGDIVDGKFTAQHFGPMLDRDGYVRLRIDFEAAGPRLDAAALKWRQRLLGGGDETFEQVTLSVRERSETVVRPATMQPAWAETERVTTVKVGDEAKEIRERRRWTFGW